MEAAPSVAPNGVARRPMSLVQSAAARFRIIATLSFASSARSPAIAYPAAGLSGDAAYQRHRAMNFDRDRWARGWQQLFETHRLIHNRRDIRKIVVTDEADGGFAVVDVDTLWRDGETSGVDALARSIRRCGMASGS